MAPLEAEPRYRCLVDSVLKLIILSFREGFRLNSLKSICGFEERLLPSFVCGDLSLKSFLVILGMR
jgi:hypothetical protein